MKTPKKPQRLHPLAAHFGLTLEDLERIDHEEELEKQFPKKIRPEYAPIRKATSLSPIQQDAGFTLDELNQILEREYQAWVREQKRK